LMFLAFKPLRTGLDMTLEVLPSIWSILFLVALFLFSITALAFAMIHEQMGDNPVVAPTVTRQFLNYGVACQTMFYFLMKRSDACAEKAGCPCSLRKREKAAIGVAALHCLLLAVNLYFFAEFALHHGWRGGDAAAF